MTHRSNVKLGVEVFLEKHLDLVKSKRVGLITNPTGTDSAATSTIILFANAPDIHLAALYGPEHGVRGDAQAGEYVPFDREKKLDIPVFSLYGQSKTPDQDMMANIDESMRSFDTVDEGKLIEPSMVENIDILVFDIQDVGTRIYTYIATMAYAMQTCAENNKEFIVLDRPNPINGTDMEGPILEYPKYSSFVGLYPIPVRHGMTVGELAQLFNSNFLSQKTNLTVIPMKGWERSMWFDETALPWIFPSPNMPSLDTATVYPGQVFLEGTNVSEGRGTTKPFEIFGAPWIDGAQLAKALNNLKLPGVRFQKTWFTPEISKYQGQVCEGAQIHVTDRTRFKPFETSMFIIQAIMDMNIEQFLFHSEYFDKIMGTSTVREELEEHHDVSEIMNKFYSDLDVFNNIRKPHLLY
ncbi:MAG TPA: DUF1343 domain-containing protein [Candidatus Heimdallarchaeota archaeon]|nr:DUF1343 domain-containing protein [Candidatus Heimdallarchaeota archaeon]